MASGNVQITLLDGYGTVSAPLGQVQAVMGWCSGLSAVVGQPVAAPYSIIAVEQLPSLIAAAGYGTGIEAAGLSLLAGGTVLFMPIPASSPITAAPTVVAGTATAAPASFVTPGSPTYTGVVTATLDSVNGAWDDYFFLVRCSVAGTVGTGAGPSVQISVDAGRNWGPAISFGTASPKAIAVTNTGVTIHFTGADPMAVGDAWAFGTIGPTISVASFNTALQALAGSQYGTVGWGSTFLPANTTASEAAHSFPGCGFIGSDITTLQTYANSLDAIETPTALIVAARDASPPATWSGTGESDATWYGSVAGDVGAVTALNVMAVAGNYNMPSAMPSNAIYGTPSPRRPASWALAARTVAIGQTPQVMQSRVSDGSLNQIALNPASDPLDGFVYHNDGSNGPLDTARICALRTRRRGGLYVSHPNMLAPLGSSFNWWPKVAVINVAWYLANQEAENFIDSDLRVNPNGTLYINDVLHLQTVIGNAMDSVLVGQGMVSGPTSVVVNQSANVAATSKVPITITVYGRGYVDEFDILLGFNNPLAAS